MNDAKQEEILLSKVRNVALDAQATNHMIHSFLSGEKEWVCRCMACEYLRKSPQIVHAIAKTIVRNYKR